MVQVYLVVFIDALIVKIRDGVVANRPACLAIGIDCEGRKQVLGLWAGPTTGESAKFWLTVLSELKSRKVADVCIVCCDGLTGLPDAISAAWPQAVVQLCVVYIVRASLRYASCKYWVPLARDLRPVCTAADEGAAAAALEAFAAAWKDRYPACGGRPTCTSSTIPTQKLRVCQRTNQLGDGPARSPAALQSL
jgi:transposase-like protein